MKTALLALPLAAFAVASATFSTAANAPAEVVTNVSVDYTFHDLPLNSMGVKTLAELRGKPVIVDFWGRN